MATFLGRLCVALLGGGLTSFAVDRVLVRFVDGRYWFFDQPVTIWCLLGLWLLAGAFVVKWAWVFAVAWERDA